MSALDRILKLKSMELFLLGARVCFGIWILYLGIGKWVNGPAGFVGYIESGFGSTWIPGILLTIMAWLILIAEPLFGLWLLSGKRQRLAWLCTALLMFILTMGQTVLGEYGVVANNWQYLILALVCASWSDAK